MNTTEINVKLLQNWATRTEGANMLTVPIFRLSVHLAAKKCKCTYIAVTNITPWMMLLLVAGLVVRAIPPNRELSPRKISKLERNTMDTAANFEDLEIL